MIRRSFFTLLSILVFASCMMAQKDVRMGVVLPLKEKNVRGAKMVEFYQGILMAVDSLKHHGINIHVQALHSGSSAADMDALVASHQIEDCDVIFGPLDAAQLPALADYCNLKGIHLVVPFSSLATQVANHPRHYLVNAPRLTVQREAIWFIQNVFSDYNLIFVECNEKNDEGKSFSESFYKSMYAKGINVKSLNVNDDDLAFLQAFNSMHKNLVILSSNSLKAVNQMIPKLKDFKRKHPEYEFSLFGYPSWQTYTTQLLSDFYDLDTYVYSNFYRNPLSRRSEAFDQHFMSCFHTQMAPTFPRYGIMGFDIAYFFLRGLSIYGRERLASHITKVPAMPFQHPLFFEQNSKEDGFVNTFVQLIHYTPKQSIELITSNQK